MTYSLTVRTKDGVSQVVSESGVPDGEHDVQGYESPEQIGLSVNRRDPDGRFVASATHTHNRES